ncbi:MAG TPA: hypothetical protein VFB81_24585, partial [Myxococcales bacterium]|nr:hypothetical protein [Myxococcales bacterium]
TQYRPELQARAGALPLAGRTPRPSLARWRGPVGGFAAALAAALVLWLGWSKLLDQVPDSTWYPAGTYRLAEGRSAHPRARAHRPMLQGVLGPSPEQGAVSYDALGKLERKGDVLGVAAAHLSHGKPHDAEEAMDLLEGVDPTPDVLSELAYAHLVRGDSTLGDVEEALRLADRALAQDPRHGSALWNRALALKALGLQLVAARAFDAAAALGEPGWGDEGRARAQELHALADTARRTWYAAIEAGKELISTGAQPSQDLLGIPLLRHYFYDAVRSRASKAEVEQLLPLARELDARAGDRALETYVSTTASRNFAVRGPLAAEYRRLALGDQTVDTAALLRQLRKAGEADLLLGVLAKLPVDGHGADELGTLARQLEADAWLRALALRLQGEALAAAGRVPDSRAALEEAVRTCQQARLDYRCAEAEMELAFFYDMDPSQLEVANAHARRGWEAALRAQAWSQQGQLVLELAQQARHREDISVSRAFYEEGLERDGSTEPERARYAHEGLASLDVKALRIDDARRHIDAALRTGRPLGLPGALALADIARLKPESERDVAAMEAFRTRLPGFPPGERALAEEALGRWEIERDRQRGETLLRSAIQRATDGDLAAVHPIARRALAYSYTSLIFDAGKRGDAEGALRLFEEEWLAGARGALPSRCLLAVTYDAPERVLAVVRGPEGGPPVAVYDGSRRTPLPGNLSGFLPADVLARLAGCPRVDVLARAPLYGRPGLLPPDIAWSYRGAVSQSATQDGDPRRHLVVQEVTLSQARRPLKTPPRWSVPQVQGEALEELTRQDAIPPVVLRRMEDATDITFIVHAL